MAIITTPGDPDAVAYASVADFKAFTDARALTYPDDDAPIEAALIRATDWIDGRYSLRWRGLAATPTQALAWPRLGAVTRSGHPIEGVPSQLIRANAAAALFEITNPGGLTQTYVPLQGKVLTEVSGIKWSLVNDPSAPDGWRIVLPLVDDLLTEILRPAARDPSMMVV